MENIEKEAASYTTEVHNKEIDDIYQNSLNDFDDVVFNDKDLIYNLKILLRLYRKKIHSRYKSKFKKEFKQILYVTMENSPIDYVSKLREQHPEKEIIVLMPIIGEPEGLEKTSVSFDFYCQNRIVSATLYKYPKNKENVDIYGLYSSAFSRFPRCTYIYPRLP